MITNIPISEKDKEILRSLNVDEKTLANVFLNYAGLVIRKPWGHEYLIFENEHVAVWVLYLKQGFQTSLHCHPYKRSSLTVLSGEILFHTFEREFTVRPSEGLLIDKGVFHSSKAISEGGAIIMETETPNNKSDLVRFEDKYGREHMGYEGKEAHGNMEEALGSFHDLAERYVGPKTFGECDMIMVKHGDRTALIAALDSFNPHLVSMVRGAFHKEGKEFLKQGDIVTLHELKKMGDFDIMDDVEVLLMRHAGDKKQS
jgi:mannose-6-phosphate isomerase-like protein (cupin superfamily)